MGMPNKRAVIYARYSSDLQTDRSIEDQLTLCRAFAAKQGFDVVQVFFDRARSGASLFGRDGILSLIEGAKARAFDVVVVEALDRVSRDQEDLAAIFKRLTFVGIPIIAVHDGTADAVQIGIRGLVGSLYLTDLANKVRRGLSGRVKEGLSAGGKAYGYKPVLGKPGELTIDPDEAAIVKRIFGEFAAGNSPRSIAYALNADEVPPPRGAAWNASTIYGSPARLNGILRNSIYGGRMVWNRLRMVRDPDTGKRLSRLNPENEWHFVDVPDLRIVDAETIEEVNARLRGMKPRGGEYQARNKRLLSGLMRCGECGSGMTLDGKTNGHPRIRCSRSRESGSCDHKRRYQLHQVEHQVVDDLKKALNNPSAIRLYVDEYFAERRRRAIENANNRNRIERDLAKRKGELERLLDAYLRGLFSVDQLAERRPPIDDDIERLTKMLADVPEIDKVEFHPKAIKRYCELIEALENELSKLRGNPTSETMSVFRELVAEIIIHPTPPHHYPLDIEIKGRLDALLNEDIGLMPQRRKMAIGMVAEGRVNQNSHNLVMTITRTPIALRSARYRGEKAQNEKRPPASPKRTQGAKVG